MQAGLQPSQPQEDLAFAGMSAQTSSKGFLTADALGICTSKRL